MLYLSADASTDAREASKGGARDAQLLATNRLS
jgi:hypothetical protein